MTELDPKDQEAIAGFVKNVFEEGLKEIIGVTRNTRETCEEVNNQAQRILHEMYLRKEIPDGWPVPDAGGYKRLAIKEAAQKAVNARIEWLTENKPKEWIEEYDASMLELEMLRYEISECHYYARQNRGPKLTVLFIQPDGRPVDIVKWLKENRHEQA